MNDLLEVSTTQLHTHRGSDEVERNVHIHRNTLLDAEEVHEKQCGLPGVRLNLTNESLNRLFFALEVEVHALRVLDAMQKGRPGVAEAAASKISHTLVCQKLARFAFEVGGPEPLVSTSPMQILWLQSLWETIGGGTTEIMRSIVAGQELGLSGKR